MIRWGGDDAAAVAPEIDPRSGGRPRPRPCLVSPEVRVRRRGGRAHQQTRSMSSAARFHATRRRGSSWSMWTSTALPMVGSRSSRRWRPVWWVGGVCWCGLRRVGCTPTSRRRRVWSSGRGRPPGPGSTSAAMAATSSCRPRCASSTRCRSATRSPTSATTSRLGSDSARLRDFLDPRPGPSCGPVVRWCGSQMWSGWRPGSPDRARANGTVALFWAACRLAENGVAASDARDVLVAAAQQPGFDEREIARTVNSAYRRVHAGATDPRRQRLVRVGLAGGRQRAPVRGLA